MAHTLVRPDRLQGDTFVIDGAEAHHLVRVLRRQVGDEIDLFDGVSRRCRGVITGVDASIPAAFGTIVAELPVHAGSYRLRLFQGLPKGSKIDFVLEKAVELGVDAVVPFVSAKGQVKLDEEGGAAKADRWKRLVQAAAKQCERADIPPVSRPVSVDDLKGQAGATLVLSLRAAAPTLKTFLRAGDSWSSFAGDSGIINVVVGPESGLTDDEEDRLVASGARLVSLGDRVLRTETAGLAALAILQHELNTD